MGDLPKSNDMFASSFSQGSAMAFGSQIQSTPQKSRAEDRQTCLPVMAKVVAAAAANVQGGEELQIHGQDVAMVLLVGIVEQLVEGAASLEFVLNDSTGRLRIRQYFTGGNEAGKVMPGQYVTVVGGIRSTPELRVSAQFVNPVVSADEVSYHVIESAHAALKLRTPQGQAVGTQQLQPAHVPQAFSTPTKSPALVAVPSLVTTSKVDTLMAGGDDTVGAAVLALLQRMSDKPEGLAAVAIAKELAPTSEAVVKKCLATLVDAGEIFNTIDDNHFGAL